MAGPSKQQLAEALLNLQRAFVIKATVLGLDSPSTERTRTNLRALYLVLNHDPAAKDLEQNPHDHLIDLFMAGCMSIH